MRYILLILSPINSSHLIPQGFTFRPHQSYFTSLSSSTWLLPTPLLKSERPYSFSIAKTLVCSGPFSYTLTHFLSVNPFCYLFWWTSVTIPCLKTRHFHRSCFLNSYFIFSLIRLYWFAVEFSERTWFPSLEIS